MNLLRTALKHAQLPLRSFPLPIPPPTLNLNLARGPWTLGPSTQGTITQRQPDLTQPALLPSPPFTTDATLFAPHQPASTAAFSPLDPIADVKPTDCDHARTRLHQRQDWE